MTETLFKSLITAIAAVFTIIFCVIVVPSLIAKPDIIGAFAAGFANPYSSGYSVDVFACWFILAAWIVFEAKTLHVKNGWICLVLGFVPGVAVGLAAYLLIRMKHFGSNPR